MGDYADDFNDAGIDEWRGSGSRRGGAQYWGRAEDFPPQYTKAAKRCQRCGDAPLYWCKIGQGWRLHAYESGQYVLHTCDSGSRAEREDSRSEAEAEGRQSGGEAASPITE